jgi:hypothetical protein
MGLKSARRGGVRVPVKFSPFVPVRFSPSDGEENPGFFYF